jgi:hypothetical protein
VKAISVSFLFPGCIYPDKLINTPTFEESIRKILDDPPANKSEWIYALIVLASGIAGYWIKQFLQAKNRSIIITPSQPETPATVQKQIDSINRRLSNVKIIFEEEKT